MNKLTFKRKAFRFRQFSGKAYAAFMSIHREVTIGNVCAKIADKEMLKAGRAVALAALMFTSGIAYAEEEAPDDGPTLQTQAVAAMQAAITDSVHRQFSLQEVSVVVHKAEVNSQAYRLVTQISHSEIEALPIQTVADILRYLPGLDVRTRGANGAQADVSMRGGTFDQVLIMINGVCLNDAHTGHYAMNLPISAELIERIEIMQGTSANIFGLNAFAGAINIITSASEGTNTPASAATMRLTAGMNGLVNPAVSGQWNRGDWRLAASAEYNRSDGYMAPSPSEKEQKACDGSDYKICNLYLRTGYRGLDIQLGAQYKDAGAGMYYGFGSQDQFDATRTAFSSARWQHRWDAWTLDLQASYRANYDRYEWHRGQRLYGNFHFSQNSAASAKVHYASKIGKTSIGLELRNENIHSTNLGDTINPDGQVPNVEGFNLKDVRVLDLVRGKNRLNINYFAEQAFFWNNLSASIGISGNWNNMYGSNITGGANLGYEYLPHSSVYLNAGRSLRLPTFTDLYYNAGNQLGNRDLKPEEAWTLSLGNKYVTDFGSKGSLALQADAYYRWGRNIIDWVYTPDDQKRPYHAQNWNEVDAAGAELTVGYSLNQWLRHAQLAYAYTWLNLDVDKSGSRYLDYLSHKLVLQLEHGICRTTLPGGEKAMIGASWTLTWQKREGQYNDAQGEVQNYTPVCLLDGQLFWQAEKVKVAIDCTNITNRKYYDYGGILQPGAWLKASITAKL